MGAKGMTDRIKVQIDGCLLQHKLEQVLAAIVGSAAWRGKEVQVISGRRQRWDMVYVGALGKVAVEFDGDEHYRHTLKIKSDLEKDELAKLGGYGVVRVPYWVQLTSETLEHYFSLEADIIQDFPHGFITTKVFPASFCELGIARFERELNSVPTTVRRAVISSLRDRSREHGIEYVVPQKLTGLLHEQHANS
jgi:hypothetical protein